jgi:hypothetical protein
MDFDRKLGELKAVEQKLEAAEQELKTFKDSAEYKRLAEGTPE